MGMRDVAVHMLQLVGWSDIDRERELDECIREALVEEAVALPPACAWDRLRRTISERHMGAYGMWVLDEPQRDPPEHTPLILTRKQMKQVPNLNTVAVHAARWQVRELVIWASMMPSFSAMVNW